MLGERPTTEATSCRTAFKFPFEPYAVQFQLMTAVYNTLCAGGVGIFESPTGTGKSLSLICSSLRWLKENPVFVAPAERVRDEDDKDLPQWVLDHVKKRAGEERKRSEEREKDRLGRVRKRMADDAVERSRKIMKPGIFVLGGPKGLLSRGKTEGGELLLKTYGLNKEANKEDRLILSDEEVKDDNALKTLMKEVLGNDSDDEARERAEDDELDVRKIIYCSRTHSQLSQFMREVNPSPIPPSYGGTVRRQYDTLRLPASNFHMLLFCDDRV